MICLIQIQLDIDQFKWWTHCNVGFILPMTKTNWERGIISLMVRFNILQVGIVQNQYWKYIYWSISILKMYPNYLWHSSKNVEANVSRYLRNKKAGNLMLLYSNILQILGSSIFLLFCVGRVLCLSENLYLSMRAKSVVLKIKKKYNFWTL